MSKFKAILKELSRKALNYPAGELDVLIEKTEEDLTDDDVTKISAALNKHYVTSIQSIRNTAKLEGQKEAGDDKFKAGQRKASEEFENNLRTKFAITSDKTGQDLIDEIHATASKGNGKKGDQLTDDDIKKTPAFQQMESTYKGQLKKLTEDKDKEIATLQTGFQKDKIFSKVKEKALELFDSRNPILSEDPAKAAKQKQLFIDQLSKYEFADTDGKFIPSLDGKVATNEAGHTLDFDTLVTSIGDTYFDFQTAEARQSPNQGGGNNGQQGKDGKQNGQQGKKTYLGKMPTTDAEYTKLQNDQNLSIEHKLEINDFWEKKQPAPAGR